MYKAIVVNQIALRTWAYSNIGWTWSQGLHHRFTWHCIRNMDHRWREGELKVSHHKTFEAYIHFVKYSLVTKFLKVSDKESLAVGSKTSVSICSEYRKTSEKNITFSFCTWVKFLNRYVWNKRWKAAIFIIPQNPKTAVTTVHIEYD